MEKLLKKINITTNSLYEIGKNKINIDDINFHEKIFRNDNLELDIDTKKINKFIKSLKIIRLNHVGVSYAVPDLKKEVIYLKENLIENNLYLDKNSDLPNQLWLFIGDKNYKKMSTMFEVVLTKASNKPTSFRPHFQIDYDTENTIEEINELSIKYFGKNVFTWSLDIPHYGVVLTMGCVGKIGDVKIFLGIGTKLRRSIRHTYKLL